MRKIEVLFIFLIVPFFTESTLPYSIKKEIFEICDSSALQSDPGRSWDVLFIARIAELEEYAILPDAGLWFLWARKSDSGFSECYNITLRELGEFAVLNITSIIETVTLVVESARQNYVYFFDKKMPGNTYGIQVGYNNDSVIYIHGADVFVFRIWGNVVERARITMESLAESLTAVYYNLTEPVELLDKPAIFNGRLIIHSKQENCSVPLSEVINFDVNAPTSVITSNCELKNYETTMYPTSKRRSSRKHHPKKPLMNPTVLVSSNEQVSSDKTNIETTISTTMFSSLPTTSTSIQTQQVASIINLLHDGITIAILIVLSIGSIFFICLWKTCHKKNYSGTEKISDNKNCIIVIPLEHYEVSVRSNH
uniref:Uncharacterized protein n=1 Tax=Panagrolaimus sp. JU765 TaxID=591449 RepID=A0AC34RMU2_9BILA